MKEKMSYFIIYLAVPPSFNISKYEYSSPSYPYLDHHHLKSCKDTNINLFLNGAPP